MLLNSTQPTRQRGLTIKPDPTTERVTRVNSYLKFVKDPKAFSIWCNTPPFGRLPSSGCIDSQKKLHSKPTILNRTNMVKVYLS
jgi:hypothetical protein